MSDRSPGPSALRRRTQRCPLQRNSPKEKTAEEGDLSSSVLDKALSSNSAQAPGLIMGAEQSRVRTKQVLCNQQLAVACDGLQSQPELSLLHAYTNTHKLNTASAINTHAYTQHNKQNTFVRPHRHDLEAQHPYIQPHFPSISTSLSCSSTPPFLSLHHHWLVCSPPSYSSLSFLCEIGSWCMRSKEVGWK